MTRDIYRVEITGLDVNGTAKTFYFASEKLNTGPGHPRAANKPHLDRLTQPMLFRRDLFAQGATRGEPTIAHGEIVFSNFDGALDYLITDYNFDAQKFRVFLTSSANINVEKLIFAGVTEQAEATVADLKMIVREYLANLDVVYQKVKFAGTNVAPNGLEGTIGDIKGRPKPSLYGEVLNVEPVPVNTVRFIYQLHDRNLNAFGNSYVKAYDSRVLLTQGALKTLTQFQAGITALVCTADLVTYIVTTSAAHGYTTGTTTVTFNTSGTVFGGLSTTITYWARVLSTTTFTLHLTQAAANAGTGVVVITSAGVGTQDVSDNRTAAGSWDWCNDTTGYYIRLGVKPIGQVTCDALNSTSPGGSVDLLAQIIAQNQSGIYWQIQSTFADYTVGLGGIYVTEETTILKVMNTLLASNNLSPMVYASWNYPDATSGDERIILLGYIVNPATATLGAQSLLLSDNDFLSGPDRVVSSDPERGIPAYRITVNYQKNYTIQSANVVGATSPDLALVQQQYRTKVADTVAIKTQFPKSPELILNTLLSTDAAAGNVLYFLQSVYSTRRDVLVCSIHISKVINIFQNVGYASGPTLGSVVQITSKRFNAVAGRKFILIGYQIDIAAGKAELTLWG